MSRPAKFSPDEVAEMLRKAMATNDGRNGMLLTDRQIFHVMNKPLKRCDRICYRTFQRYKSAAMAWGEQAVALSSIASDTYAELYETLMDNEIEQKLNLYDAMLKAETPMQQRNFKWTLERKFPDLNMQVAARMALAQYDMTEKANSLMDMASLQKEMTPPCKT